MSFNAETGKLEKSCNDFCKWFHNGRCAMESISLSLYRLAGKYAPDLRKCQICGEDFKKDEQKIAGHKITKTGLRVCHTCFEKNP